MITEAEQIISRTKKYDAMLYFVLYLYNICIVAKYYFYTSYTHKQCTLVYLCVLYFKYGLALMTTAILHAT